MLMDRQADRNGVVVSAVGEEVQMRVHIGDLREKQGPAAAIKTAGIGRLKR